MKQLLISCAIVLAAIFVPLFIPSQILNLHNSLRPIIDSLWLLAFLPIAYANDNNPMDQRPALKALFNIICFAGITVSTVVAIWFINKSYMDTFDPKHQGDCAGGIIMCVPLAEIAQMLIAVVLGVFLGIVSVRRKRVFSSELIIIGVIVATFLAFSLLQRI